MRTSPNFEEHTAELHISSVVLWLDSAQHDSLMRWIQIWPDAVVHPTLHAEKLVITLETTSFGDIHAFVEQLNAQPGVRAAHMVYHHVESASDLTEDLMP
jgi:nitrate reductase NapAB chaperone NapD